MTEVLWIVAKSAQIRWFASLYHTLLQGRMISKPFTQLSPFIDSTGVISVGGRLCNADLPINHRHPILVHKESHLALLAARHWHILACHARPSLLTVLIHKQFWVPNTHRGVYRTMSQYVVYVKLTAVHPQPAMADLPQNIAKKNITDH